MPRRNDISKIMMDFGLKRLVAFAISFLFVVTLHPPAQACSRSMATVLVSSDFRVIVSHGSEPVPGIQVAIYDEREHPSGATERKPLLTLATSGDGAAEVRNLEKGVYLVETKGPGGGSAVYAKVGDRSDKVKNEISLEWPFPGNSTLKTRSLSGELVSNDPWKPFQNVQVKLWAAGLDKPLAAADTGPEGLFHFDESRSGLYVLSIRGRQDDVNPDNQIEGNVSVELSPLAPNALPSLALRLDMTTCGIEYSTCLPGDETPITTASRRIRVMHEPGVSETPGVENAKYKLVNDRGALIAEGAADHEGIVELPPEFVGKGTLVVASPLMTTAQQALDLLPLDERASDIVVTMTTFRPDSRCSAVTLEKNATSQ